MRTSTLIPATLAFACLRTAHPQQPPAGNIPTTLTGSVTGHITYADTQLPARYASVILVHKPTNEELNPPQQDLPHPAPPNMRRPQAEPSQVVSVSARSGTDGTFRIDGVPTGDYLLVARVPGYLIPGASALGATVQQQIASLPAVHVAAGQVASANLGLTRGAALGGHVQFPDGSPVIAASVEFQSAAPRPVPQDEEVPNYLPLDNALHEGFTHLTLSSKGETTDDQGHYRLSGVAPGKYLLLIRIKTDSDATQISVGGQYSLSSTGNHGLPQPLTLYQPGVFRRKEARIIEIHADEQLLDLDIKVDPSSLHTVHGRLVAGEDRHAPKEATVQLRESDSTDPRDFGHLAQSAPDGSFQIPDLPAGSYILAVALASDEDLSKRFDEARQLMSEQAHQDGIGAVSSVHTLTQTYKSPSIPVLLGDHDLTLEDIVLTPAHPNPDPHSTPPQ